jgi:hypothetical protein
MSWGDNIDQLQHERMIDMLEGALLPQKLVITEQMRHAVISDIQSYIRRHVPPDYAWIIDMALLHYGCLALTAKPEETQGESNEPGIAAG